MTTEIKDKTEVSLSDLTPEDKEKLWEEWVRGEVGAALDIYLPISKAGHVNLSYSSVVLEQTEAGPVFSDNMKDAVMISLIFDFKEPIDITKPRIGSDEAKKSDTE